MFKQVVKPDFFPIRSVFFFYKYNDQSYHFILLKIYVNQSKYILTVTLTSMFINENIC